MFLANFVLTAFCLFCARDIHVFIYLVQRVPILQCLASSRTDMQLQFDFYKGTSVCQYHL